MLQLASADFVVLVEGTVIAFAQIERVRPDEDVAWVQFCAPMVPVTGMCEPNEKALVLRVVQEGTKPFQRDQCGGFTAKDLQVLTRMKGGPQKPFTPLL